MVSFSAETSTHMCMTQLNAERTDHVRVTLAFVTFTVSVQYLCLSGHDKALQSCHSAAPFNVPRGQHRTHLLQRTVRKLHARMSLATAADVSHVYGRFSAIYVPELAYNGDLCVHN